MPQTQSRSWRHFLPALVGFLVFSGVFACALFFAEQAKRKPVAETARMVYVRTETPKATSALDDFSILTARFREQMGARAELFLVTARLPGDPDREAKLAADIGRINPSMILATSALDARSSRAAFPDIPLLFLSNADPQRLKLIEGVASTNTNATGVSFYQPIEGKQLELLQRCVPAIGTIGVLLSGSLTDTATQALYVNAGAQLGLAVALIRLPTTASWLEVSEAMSRQTVDAWLFPSTTVAGRHRGALVEYVNAKNVPASFARHHAVREGALMSYEDALHNWHDVWVKQAALILDGLPPTKIPVERPRTFDFTLNLATAARIKGFDKRCLDEVTTIVGVAAPSSAHR